jgi:radical SAM superfamily enzyme YgiQ (UPF0313 family)
VSHFSNIIGFPEDTSAGIREHLNVLRELGPDVASFYILCPIPGTEQYDAFLAAGSISEVNLDRFDGTRPTWRHPNLSARELQDLLFHCYRRFYSLGHIFLTALRTFRPDVLSGLPCLGHPLFSRLSIAQGMHPMSGGLGRVRIDSVADYRELRYKQFGFEHAPLPKSLELSKADADLNRHVQLAI